MPPITTTDNLPTDNKHSYRPGRRTILRAGTTAAWAVPVIAAAAPAQAAACSGSAATLTATLVGNTTVQVKVGKKYNVTATVLLCNTGNVSTCGLYLTATGTLLTHLGVDLFGIIDAQGAGSASLTVLAPLNAQIAAGVCVTVVVNFIADPGDVALTFGAAGSALAVLNIHVGP